MKWLNLFSNINAVIFLLLTALYFYQFVYMGVGLYTKHKKYPKANKQLRYAIMICARNEENIFHFYDSIGSKMHALASRITGLQGYYSIILNFTVFKQKKWLRRLN